MIRAKSLWIGLGLVLCCILLFMIATFPSGQASTAPVQATPTRVSHLSSGLGMPAIHPSSNNTARLPSTAPRFTIDDVKTYLQTHPFVGGTPIQGAAPKVTNIQFMTSTKASVLLHGAETGLPGTATVCYVKIQGPFAVAAPSPSGAKQASSVAYGVEIFDGRTGNLLMWWVPSV